MKPVRVFTIIMILLLGTAASGCRRAPSNVPELYEREKIAQAELASAPQPVWLPDRYPWQGKTNRMKDLPLRLETYQRSIEEELKILDRIVHRLHQIK